MTPTPYPAFCIFKRSLNFRKSQENTEHDAEVLWHGTLSLAPLTIHLYKTWPPNPCSINPHFKCISILNLVLLTSGLNRTLRRLVPPEGPTEALTLKIRDWGLLLRITFMFLFLNFAVWGWGFQQKGECSREGNLRKPHWEQHPGALVTAPPIAKNLKSCFITTLKLTPHQSMCVFT